MSLRSSGLRRFGRIICSLSQSRWVLGAHADAGPALGACAGGFAGALAGGEGDGAPLGATVLCLARTPFAECVAPSRRAIAASFTASGRAFAREAAHFRAGLLRVSQLLAGDLPSPGGAPTPPGCRFARPDTQAPHRHEDRTFSGRRPRGFGFLRESPRAFPLHPVRPASQRLAKRPSADEVGPYRPYIPIAVKRSMVARMSEATCGTATARAPGCRFAHPGYACYACS
jgi:hypothetical protein